MNFIMAKPLKVSPWMSMLDFTPFVANLSLMLRPVISYSVKEEFVSDLRDFCLEYELEETATNLNIALAKSEKVAE